MVEGVIFPNGTKRGYEMQTSENNIALRFMMSDIVRKLAQIGLNEKGVLVRVLTAKTGGIDAHVLVRTCHNMQRTYYSLLIVSTEPRKNRHNRLLHNRLMYPENCSSLIFRFLGCALEYASDL